MRGLQQQLGHTSPCRQLHFGVIGQSIHNLLIKPRVWSLCMGPAKVDTTACQGYVGQSTPLAGEYYSRDFDYHEHAQAISHLVEQQWAAAPAAVRNAARLSPTGEPLTAVQQLLASLQAREEEADENTAVVAAAAGNAAADMPTPLQQQQQQQQQQPQQQQPQHHHSSGGVSPQLGSSNSSDSLQAHQQSGSTLQGATLAMNSSSSSNSNSNGGSGVAGLVKNEWEVFYRAHPSAKFFKERRYLLLEFPCLAPPACVQHVVEIGAGCGSSILPVLRAQPQARATVCDVSGTCLQQLMEALSLLGLNPSRCSCFVADGTDPDLAQRMQNCAADVALIMFTLSAVQPPGMLAMMQNAAAALRPGGLLCIRDHALYDMVQLRIPAEQMIGRHLYRRGDATLAYFYTVEDLSGLALAAGLEVVECEYVCVINRNRKSGLELRRTFVHGIFRRPAAQQ